MSSTYIVEPQDNSSKKDDTLIIVVNDDGTISVDQETLSNLIMNQTNANVSVVRVGQSDGDATNGDLTFTVDPPTFVPTETIRTGTQSGSTDGGLVDPFMEMDPEQLEKLETALQSEQAKQILGENVTAMLDMLTVEEQQSSIRYNIELDHCYTSRTCPSDPEPLDPLPIANSPDIDKMQYVESLPTQPTTQVVVQSRSEEPRIVQIPTPLAKKSVGRPRKIAMPVVLPSNTSKTPPTTSRPIQQETPKASPRLSEENDNMDDFSTTESSDSEPSDDDLDFGPRGPRRGGVRARGGRKGLTTRGGSMAARRGRPNKQMDVDQVRRLNIEMAAAVDAMKTPGRNDNNTPDVVTRTKRGIRTMGGKKKEEISTDSASAIIPTPIPIEKPLQTTNQVKANLISANMIRGDMILTKPGQSRNNQKVYFVQKKVIVQPNEMKAIAPKKSPIVVTKGPMKMPYQIQTKLALSEDGKFIAISPKPAVAAIQNSQISQQEEPLQIVVPENQQLPVKLHSPKQSAISSPVKIKPILEINKKDRKKSESELTMKITADEQQVKTIVDQKTPESAKKHVKKDLRKSPGIMADTLGPALFSTPDIIRRVGSLGEAKAPEISDTSVAMETSETKILEDKTTISNLESSMSPMKTQFKSIAFSEMEQSTGRLFSDTSSNIIEPVQDKPGTLMETDEHDETTEPIEANENDLRSALDAGGIEGEEHLLATLEMEATKHEEELLAEALLLQEQLDVDLADPSALDGSSSAISEALLSPSAFDAALLPLSETPQTPIKISETPSDLPITFHSTQFENIKKKEAKDSKEPIQIVRGGRIITLPPIEAPATRSKRLQSKPDSPKASRTLEIHEKEEKSPKQFTPQTQIKQMDEIDSEMEDDDGEENSDSEDDPNRLWCICKRPHNNRFMICCDVCEDWFHGKCVNVTKAKAQQYEQQGKDWVCPNCRAKKKAEEPSTPKSSKTPPKKLNKSQENILTSPKTPETFQAAEKQNKVISEWTSNIQAGFVVTQCVVCKKEARNSSIYCSDACILMHAQETLGKDKPVPSPQQKTQMKITNDSPKATQEARVIVFERRTGKVLTGNEAPTTSNLKTWLKEHPTFEIVRPNNFNTLQIGGKTLSTIPTQSGKTGKLVQQQGNSGQAKMIFTKVSGSKQTVLAPSHKKVTIVPAQNANKAQVHHVVVAPKKSPAPLKQTTLKTVPIAAKVPVTPKQQAGKKLEQKSTPSTTTLKVKPSSMRKGETEPIRVTVRKTLAELLSTRIKETEDLKLSEEEIGDLALKIELEMYKFFKDPGAKYKAKYRSLVFNIKDVKNLTLFRKIADKSLAPDAVVRLSAEEMASQELAEWRENETKHQLEMIKKNELDLMAQAKSIVVKTHKGELIIENEGGLGDVDPKTPVQDIVTVLNSGDNTCSDVLDEKDETTSSSLEDLKKSALKINDKKKKEREREKDGHRSREKEHKDSKRDRSSSRSQKHRNRDRSRDRRRSKDGKRDKEKVRDRDKDKVKEKSKDKERSGRSSKSRSKSSRSSHKEKEIKSEDEKMKKEVEKRKELSPVQMEKPIEERLWRHIEEETTTNIIDGNDSDVSDREPSSTVNIKTPDINEELEKEKDITLEIEPSQNRGNNKELSTKAQTVWRGFVSMPEVAKFFITAQELSGRAKDLMADLPDTVDVVGRISHVIVWDYISKMMRTGSKEILVIRMTAANDEEKLPYITLYSYLNSRSRLGVVGSVSKNIKDFYIMPFPSHNQIPPVLASLIGPGFEENRPHLLLGIITRNKRKRVSLALPPQIVPKILKKETESRSVTPPKEKHSGSDKISHVDEQLSVTQMTLNSLNKAHVGMSRASIETAKISKIVPELSLKLDLTASPEKPTDDDDGDEPYSPGGIDGDESNDNLMKLTATTSYTSTEKNPTELQRKMDELNRQIEEQKMQIQNMSSSFLESPGPTLPGLGLDPLGNDSDEAYSPSDARSFTPPPQSIPKFAQPLLDKVSDITIPPNLQEILANVKKQEFSKVDPYLPTKPGASFLTGLSTSLPRSPEKTYTPTSVTATKENTTSTLRSLSDMDLIKKAEEELAAVAAAEAISKLPDQIELPPDNEYSSFLDQPKPPGLEDEEEENDDNSGMTINNDSRRNSNKFVPKSGVVLCVKRKTNDDGSNPVTPAKTPRTKSRWGQGPTAD